MFVLLRRLPATKVSALTYLPPPLTIVLGFFVFGDAISAADIFGLGMAAIAVYLVTATPRHSRA